jgi:hypothetical protein
VTVLLRRVGQCCWAAVACLQTSSATASRLSALPRLVGKSGSVGSPRRSCSQTRRTAAVCVVSGVQRCLRPLPLQRRWAPVLAAEPGQLGDAQAGLEGDQQECVVATTDPAAAVGCGEQGVDLFAAEEGDDGPLEAFGRDGEHALDQRGVLGVA